MRLKNIEWKKVLLEKGERIGLYICVGIMALLLVSSLVKAFSSGSATENANQLREKNAAAKRTIETSAPSEEFIAQHQHIDEKLLKRVDQVKHDPAPYRPDRVMFLAPSTEDNKRRRPPILAPVEFRAAYVQIPMVSYMFTPDKTKIWVHPSAPPNSLLTRGPGDARKDVAKLKTAMLTTAPLPGGADEPGPMPSLGGTPFDVQPAGGGAAPKAESKPVAVDLKQFEEPGKNLYPANDLRPVRAVMVVGSFPLRQQAEKVQQALRLRTLESVFTEPWLGDTSKANPKAQYYLSGLNVRRRTVEPDGTRGEWVKVDLDATYKPLVVYAGLRWQEEDPDLAQLKPFTDAIFIPRPLQVGGQYPPIEKELPTIRSTLDEIANQNKPAQAAVIKQRSRFNLADISLFSLDAPPEPPSAPTPAKDVKPVAEKEWAPPEYVPLRFFDVQRIEPGKTYEYQIQIQMLNPNYKHPNVVYPALAKEQFLLSEWFDVHDGKGNPLQVKVPSESYFYAIERPASLRGGHQAAVQFHRYLDYVPLSGSAGATGAVGSWVVADALVNRGEYIRRTTDEKTPVKVKVPIWYHPQENFVLPINRNVYPISDQQKTAVAFEPGNGKYLLIDFQGGPTNYTKAAGSPNERGVSDKTPTELIYLSPDGKLLARDSETDKQDPTRVHRAEEYKKRVEEIEGVKK